MDVIDIKSIIKAVPALDNANVQEALQVITPQMCAAERTTIIEAVSAVPA